MAEIENGARLRRARTYANQISLPLIAVLAAAVLTGGPVADADASEAQLSASEVAAASSTPARVSVIRPVRPVGAEARIAGRVPLGSHDRVAIAFRPDGSRSWQGLGRTRSNARGLFSVAIPAVRNGAVRAVPRIGQPSRPAEIRVLSRTRFGVTRRHVNLGEDVGLLGRSHPGGRRAFRVVVKGPDGKVVDRVTNRAGQVRAGWRPSRAGRYVLEAFSGANGRAYGSNGPRRVVDVYRPAGASWYGPAFYGGRSACGLTLTPSTTGVAHKTLPCGTRVRLRYGDRVVSTRVIDRGPFIPGREFDLIESTRNALGFDDVGTIHVSH